MEKNNIDYVDNILINYFTNVNYEVPEFILESTDRTIKNLNKGLRIIEIIKKLIITLIGIMTLTGGVYAVIKDIVKPKIEFVEDAEIKDENSLGFYHIEDMKYLVESEIYYKKITNYEEYIQYRNNYNNFIEMQENEFQEYFLMFFLAPKFTNKQGLYVDYIEVTEETIYVDLGKKEYKDNPLVFVKMNKENDRENVEVNFLENEPIMSNYVARDELPIDYTLNQAIEDNCVVIDEERFLSEEEVLKEFINRTKEGMNDNVRIVENMLYGIIITDIEFRDGKYIVCVDRSHVDMPYKNQRTRIYYVVDRFECETFSERNSDYKEAYFLIEDRNPYMPNLKFFIRRD